jgi:hypothetical protein
MIERLVSLSLFIFMVISHSLSQQTKISGYVKDASTGELLPYVSVRFINSKLVPRFQALVDWFESFGYQIRSLGGYNQRKIAGTDKWSTHSYGVAIDINPDKNPMVPSTTPNWTDMPIKETSATAKALGLGWGGDWRNKKDAMHFSIASNEGGDTPTKVIESAGLPIVSKSDGTQIAKNSSEIGKKQREQERKNNPVVLNVTSVNNLQVQTN